MRVKKSQFMGGELAWEFCLWTSSCWLGVNPLKRHIDTLPVSSVAALVSATICLDASDINISLKTYQFQLWLT